jgi:intein/homing endonuclease
MNDNKTTYGKLKDFFSVDKSNNNVEKETKIIIKGNSPADVQHKALELQQQRNVEKKFYKNVDHGYQKAMQYEAARLPAYLDYEGMEYYPLIASALDLFMEEATTIDHFRLLGDDKYLPYGSCLLSDSYVKTSDGIKEIKDIKKGDIVYGFDIKSQKQIQSNVLDVVCNGKKQTYKISTQHNFIKATDNHKILVYDRNIDDFEYKFVSDLKIGDNLIINPKDNYDNKIPINKKVVVKEHNGRVYDEFTHDLKYIPDHVDEDFAKLFGFLLGDGGINSKRPYMVYFAYGTHNTINEKYIKLLEKFSNKKIYLRKNNEYANGIASAVVNSKTLATILNNMGFAGNARTKRIPKWIFSTNSKIKKAFLEGLQDADGATYIDKWDCERNTIELANYSLINDLKTLVQSLGYKSGKISKRCRNNVIINGHEVKNVSPSFKLTYYKSELTQTKSLDIKNRLSNDFIIEKIKSIEEDVVGDVYDIHVDNENHNFFANNIVVHNSILNKIRRVFRQCLDSETKIWTPNGYTLIKDLNIDDEIYSYSINDENYIKSRVANISNNGIKSRYEIKTRHRRIVATNDHPFLTYNEVNGYDYKDINSINIKTDKLVLPSINENWNNKSISIDAKYYYTKLNDKGIKYVKQISSDGIMKRIKQHDTYSTPKNIHTFLRGYNRKIRHDDFLLLKNEFNIPSDAFTLYPFGKRNSSIVNNDLKFYVDINFIRFFGFMLGDGWLNYHDKSVGFALGEYDEQNNFYLNLKDNKN